MLALSSCSRPPTRGQCHGCSKADCGSCCSRLSLLGSPELRYPPLGGDSVYDRDGSGDRRAYNCLRLGGEVGGAREGEESGGEGRRGSQPLCALTQRGCCGSGVSKSASLPLQVVARLTSRASAYLPSGLWGGGSPSHSPPPTSQGVDNPAVMARRKGSLGGESPRSGNSSPAPGLRGGSGSQHSSEGDLERVTVRVYNEDRSYHSVPIDGSTTVADVCDVMIQKTLAKHDPAWSIVEHISKLQLERSLEGHELIYSIYSSWDTNNDNKFYLRKDFHKYELFRSPNQYFPESMIDVELPKEDTTGFLSRYERYKNILLQNLLSDETIPDIQGYVQLREGKRWRRHYCVLRKSGLYQSTKGDCKEPQHLALITSLEDVEIYTAAPGARKLFGAPYNFCFCLKSLHSGTELKSMRLFSVESEQARLCFITGMRFIKYGSLLRENFKLTLKYEERLKVAQNKSTAAGADSCLYGRNRVAMDFSGERGRVVADPKEALSVAIEEGHQWRIRTARLPAGTPLSRDPLSPPPDPTLTSRPQPVTLAQLHTAQPWFHSGATRDEVQALIEQQGLVDGVFLLRESQSVPDVTVLSFAHNAKVKHCMINRMEQNGQLFYSLDGGVTKFMDLIQLVDFYQLNAGALPTQLTYYVTRIL